MPLSWNEIKSRAIALAANPVIMAGAMGMTTVAGLLAYLLKCRLKPMLCLVLL
jgi:thiazole synthase ThiGH ThiG subunit